MSIENKSIGDFLEYLNPMTKTEVGKFLSDTPKLLEDCIGYFSNKIVSGKLKFGLEKIT